MKSNLIAVIKYVLVLGIGVGLLWLAFSGVKLRDTIDEIKQAKFIWLGLSVVASLVAFYSRALRWKMLIEPLGYSPGTSNTLASLMIGYFANLLVPRLGEVTRCGSLSRAEKVPFDALIGTVIIERIIDVLSLLVCVFLVAINEYSRLGNFLKENIYTPLTSRFYAFLNNPLLLFITVIVIIGLIYLVFRKGGKGGGLITKIASLAKGVAGGVVAIRKMKNPLLFLFHTVLIWTMYFLMSYWCFSALSATSALDWHAGLFVLVVGGMGMSAPVQGGIGTYHLLVSQGLILYGVSLEHGLTFATLMHTSQTLVVIILGGLSFLYLFLKKRNAKAQHT